MGLTPLAQPVDLTGIARESANGAIETAADYVRDLAPWYQGNDELFWPAIAGEPYAPTLTSGSYSNYKQRSSYNIGAIGAKVTFPRCPRIGPNGKTVQRISFDWARVGGVGETGDQIFVYGDLIAGTLGVVDRGVRARINDAGNVMLDTGDGVGNQQQSTGAIVNDATWYHFEVVLKADRVELYVDGVLRLTNAVRFWPSSATENVSIQPVFMITTAQQTSHVSAVRVRWADA